MTVIERTGLPPYPKTNGVGLSPQSSHPEQFFTIKAFDTSTVPFSKNHKPSVSSLTPLSAYNSDPNRVVIAYEDPPKTPKKKRRLHRIGKAIRNTAAATLISLGALNQINTEI